MTHWRRRRDGSGDRLSIWILAALVREDKGGSGCDIDHGGSTRSAGSSEDGDDDNEVVEGG